MTDAFRKFLVEDILRTAKDGKQIAEKGSVQRSIFARIARLARRLQVDYGSQATGE